MGRASLLRSEAEPKARRALRGRAQPWRRCNETALDKRPAAWVGEFRFVLRLVELRVEAAFFRALTRPHRARTAANTRGPQTIPRVQSPSASPQQLRDPAPSH